jgi:hypothetical protein
MKAFLRLQQGIEKRERKYAKFQSFFDGAESLFSAFINRDFGGPSQIGITINPGGRCGGKDKRLIEIFFSLIPYDKIDHEDSRLTENANQLGARTLSESGPCLVYQRADIGDIYCILRPATTGEGKVNEDMIILQTVTKPRILKALAQSHWQDLLACRECTSINGAPSLLQKLRYFYLRHFRKFSKNREYQPAKVPKWINKFVVLILSFILGGLITTTIEKRLFPDGAKTSNNLSGAKSPSSKSKCRPLLSAQQTPKPSGPKRKANDALKLRGQ